MKILIVDDDAATLLVASMALQHAGGFEVLLARNGNEALDLAEKDRPDAILMDVVMQDLDGLTILNILRDQPETAAIPVIFHTARNTPGEIRNLLSSGARGVIKKPGNPLELGNEIRRILESGEDTSRNDPH